MNQETGYNLPDKLYFRIGEVSDIVGVKPYVLRYWETEFSDIKPTKSKSGQRLYKKKDVELLLKVKELLYNERFTINGAKRRLKEVEKFGASTVSSTPSVSASSSAKHAEDIPEEQIELDIGVPEVKQKSKPEVAASDVDRKFLKKIKSDLEWCLSELRSG